MLTGQTRANDFLVVRQVATLLPRSRQWRSLSQTFWDAFNLPDPTPKLLKLIHPEVLTITDLVDNLHGACRKVPYPD